MKSGPKQRLQECVELLSVHGSCKSKLLHTMDLCGIVFMSRNRSCCCVPALQMSLERDARCGVGSATGAIAGAAAICLQCR